MNRTVFRLAALAALLVLLSSCASAGMPGAAEECSLCSLGEAIVKRNVTLQTPRIEGVAVGGRPVAEALVDSQLPGLGALLRAAVDHKQIRSAGWLLKVKVQKTGQEIEVVCEGKLASVCEDLKPYTPAVFYATPVPFVPGNTPQAEPVYLLRDLND